MYNLWFCIYLIPYNGRICNSTYTYGQRPKIYQFQQPTSRCYWYPPNLPLEFSDGGSATELEFPPLLFHVLNWNCNMQSGIQTDATLWRQESIYTNSILTSSLHLQDVTHVVPICLHVDQEQKLPTHHNYVPQHTVARSLVQQGRNINRVGISLTRLLSLLLKRTNTALWSQAEGQWEYTNRPGGNDTLIQEW